MMRFPMRSLAIGMMIAVSAPVLAQTPPPAAGAARDRPGPAHRMHGKQMFASMSEAGRATMREAMKAGGDREADRAAVKAARERMLVLLDAERLDTAALKRAMDDERKASNASRERHQAAMLAGFSKLSLADRKAFVADSRAMKSRMETRMKDWRGKRGGPDDMPPPPMM